MTPPPLTPFRIARMRPPSANPDSNPATGLNVPADGGPAR